MQPTPTEYEGTKYRSKNEAVFACFIDLCLHRRKAKYPDIKWSLQYEPKLDWIDFDIDFRLDIQGDQTIYMPMFIQHKPEKPAITYIDNFHKAAGAGNPPEGSLLFIVYGGPWSEQKTYVAIPPRLPILELEFADLICHETTQTILNLIDVAKEWRYDLP